MAVMRLNTRSAGTAAGVAGLGIVAFALGWWQGGDAGHRAFKANSPAAEWKLPEPKPADLATDAKIILAKQPFGAAGERAAVAASGAGAGAASAPSAQWRIGGIVAGATSRYLVVLVRPPGQNSDRIELRQVGESLPDGAVVRSVDPSSVTIDRQGTLVTVKMFERN